MPISTVIGPRLCLPVSAAGTEENVGISDDLALNLA